MTGGRPEQRMKRDIISGMLAGLLLAGTILFSITLLWVAEGFVG